MTCLLPQLLAAGLAASTTHAGPDTGSNSKICDFLRKYRFQSAPIVRFYDPARDGPVRAFSRSWAAGQYDPAPSLVQAPKPAPVPISDLNCQPGSRRVLEGF